MEVKKADAFTSMARTVTAEAKELLGDGVEFMIVLYKEQNKEIHCISNVDAKRIQSLSLRVLQEAAGNPTLNTLQDV